MAAHLPCCLACVLQSLLSVAGDGSICIVPMVQFTQAAAATHTFKQAAGWSGYSQGRWVDSHVFVTVSATAAVLLCQLNTRLLRRQSCLGIPAAWHKYIGVSLQSGC